MRGTERLLPLPSLHGLAQLGKTAIVKNLVMKRLIKLTLGSRFSTWE